ncbi:MAG: glutamate 5-kinase [Pirellulales bacterium]
MFDPLRQEIAATADTVVVKVGTRVLTRPDGTLDPARVVAIAEQLAELLAAGRRVVLVSSGAVGAGIGRLKLVQRPSDLAQLQAIAAVGQSCLIEAYNRALESRGHHAAQILLTADDFSDRARYLNVRNTIFALFRFGAVPIINENDTVRVDELQRNFGDNDRLAAMVTNLIRAPLLILLSDVEGLFDADPRDPKSQLISTVDDIDGAIARYVAKVDRPGEVQLSLGGMASKLDAARIATASGESVVIASGTRPNVIREVLAGELVGTIVLAKGRAVTSRKRWIGWTAPQRGRLTLDAGAARAITQQGRSLLAVGITQVEGEFAKGDVLALCDAAGQEQARGLSNYSSADLRRIMGQSTERFAEILGHCPYQEVVHRDHLTLVR